MSLSDVIRNIAKTVTSKDALKEKARDLPLLVVQTTLGAAGQALMLVDRVKHSIKGDKEEKKEDVDSRPSETPVVGAGEEAKPARKEPVIFAPRPEAAPNGTAKTKPEPVIFTPAGKPEPEAEPELKAEPETKPETKPQAEAEPKPKAETGLRTEPKPEPKPQVAVVAEPEPAVAQPVAAAEPEPEAKPKAKRKPKPKAPQTAKLAEAVETVPVAREEPALGAGELAEPLPGFASLTVASLRARMRGKNATQIAGYLAYEQATSGRPEVIRMFENRLAKLHAGE
ncbi:hypothetical protein ACQEUU_30765 [Nonomuraea sp. CA-218870]|uniref:hypothetical protein n=1 Tax=Nonomuraea sp. CA-218870 TaxID=3239998 RepID=UPI003D89F200